MPSSRSRLLLIAGCVTIHIVLVWQIPVICAQEILLEEQKLTACVASAGDFFGWAVALQGDILIVGSPEDDDNGFGSGSAYVFTGSDFGWQQEAELLASDGAEGDQFGHTVAISGNRIVVGARLSDELEFGAGAAYVYVRSGSTWNEEAKLLAEDGQESEIGWERRSESMKRRSW